MKTAINYQEAYDYLLSNNLAFCYSQTPNGLVRISIGDCVENIKTSLTMKDVLKEFDTLVTPHAC